MANQHHSEIKLSRFEQCNLRVKQKGAVLILLAYILGIGAAVYILNSYNTDLARAKQDEKTFQALKTAKTALIAWAVNYSSSPGQMPWPDRNGDGNYDGSSDCVATTFQYGFLLGQLPSQPATSPCLDPNTGLTAYTGLSTYPGLGQEFTDGQGNRLWYAVSRNMIYDYEHSENPIINPGMMNPPHAITPYLRQSGTQSYPWLEVLDRNGNLISDRVAAVIIAPGSPIGNQSRSSSAPNASEFLDGFMIGAANYKNSDSSLVNEDFIMGEDNRNVPASDTTFQKPYSFNDKLVYITIDELMDALEQRASQELKSQLNNYYVASGVSGSQYYPYAAMIGDANNVCVDNKLGGFLPIAPSQANCSTSQSCVVSFPITQVKFILAASEIYGSRVGACTRSGNTCSCTGAGSCSRASAPARTFTCTADGKCASSGTNANGSFNFTYKPKIPDVTLTSGTCLGANGNVNCIGAGSFSSPASSCSHPNQGLATLPKWFTDNSWQEYFFYQVSSNCIFSNFGCSSGNLSVGSKNGIYALLIGFGDVIKNVPYTIKGSAQSRPPANLTPSLNDYLDSAENTNGDLIFDATSKQKSSNFNDRTYIVAP